MKIWPCAGLVCWCCAATGAGAASPTAVFGLGFNDTSLQAGVEGPAPREQHRLLALNTELEEMLVHSDCCRMVNLQPVMKRAEGMDMRTCNGCDVDLAREVGASISVTGWVQKVSNLILNINLVARDVGSGRVIEAGSVDLRGNTDESWSRGLAYLLEHRLHPSDWRPAADRSRENQ